MKQKTITSFFFFKLTFSLILTPNILNISFESVIKWKKRKLTYNTGTFFNIIYNASLMIFALYIFNFTIKYVHIAWFFLSLKRTVCLIIPIRR